MKDPLPDQDAYDAWLAHLVAKYRAKPAVTEEQLADVHRQLDAVTAKPPSIGFKRKLHWASLRITDIGHVELDRSELLRLELLATA